MEAYNQRYMAYPHAPWWPEEFEAIINRASDPILVDKDLAQIYSLDHKDTMMYFWVNVIKQPQNITDRIRGMSDRMPEGYNNIACLEPARKMCGLKYVS